MREYIPLFSFVVLLFLNSTAFAFWLGSVSANHGARLSKLEEMAKNEVSTRDEVVRLKVQMEALQKVVESLDRGMQGVQSQLATIASKGFGFTGAAE